MKRILSGMQPTAQLHLGNYLGALKNWVALQNEPDSENFYMVADLHAITVPQEPEALRAATREIAAAYIAGGIDPAKSSIFVQSAVPGHSELMWLLATMTQMGKLERMTQFKDKAGKNAERAGLGLFAYPVLMAADILIYKATHVPVGEDQKQHLELAREVASTFNTRYGQDFFIQPEPFIMGAAARVMSLQDGTKKMSKSDASEKSRINLTDDAETIAKKIKKAQTDPEALPETLAGLEGRPGAKNLVTIYAALADITPEAVIKDCAGKGWGEFKSALADLAVEKLAPMTRRMQELMSDPAEIDRILAQGSEKAGALAEQTVRQTREIMGFWQRP
ncbi:MAG: tryptophan--tRNA ligase [Alphaproteobacteria bacterium]|nr:tryptophan--tRNA ligase [Alphaproteobacteria bacterium]